MTTQTTLVDSDPSTVYSGLEVGISLLYDIKM